MKFEIDIPEEVIEKSIIQAIQQYAIDCYEKGYHVYSNREYNKQVKAYVKAIVEKHEEDLIGAAVKYAGEKIAREHDN